MNIPKTDFPGLNILFDDLTPRVSGKFAAIWSLKVAKFNHCYWGVFIAQPMASLAYHCSQ